MISFTGLRAETPDLKENPTDTTEMASIYEVNSDIVSNVSTISTVQDFNFTKSHLIYSDPIAVISSGQNNMTAQHTLGSGYKKYSTVTNYAFKQDRNPRDGIRCEYKK